MEDPLLLPELKLGVRDLNAELLLLRDDEEELRPLDELRLDEEKLLFPLLYEAASNSPKLNPHHPIKAAKVSETKRQPHFIGRARFSHASPARQWNCMTCDLFRGEG